MSLSKLIIVTQINQHKNKMRERNIIQTVDEEQTNWMMVIKKKIGS